MKQCVCLGNQNNLLKEDQKSFNIRFPELWCCFSELTLPKAVNEQLMVSKFVIPLFSYLKYLFVYVVFETMHLFQLLILRQVGCDKKMWIKPIWLQFAAKLRSSFPRRWNGLLMFIISNNHIGFLLACHLSQVRSWNRSGGEWLCCILKVWFHIISKNF